MTEDFHLLTLTAEDSARYNAFFTAGTRAHPDTLRISPDDIEGAPFSTQPTEDSITLAAVAGEVWLGVVTLAREQERSKRRHIAWIVRMYVSADRAGRGVGRALLREALARAARMPGVAKVNLTVAAHNERAIRLYTAEGFTSFAREEDAFRDPLPRAELSMSRPVAG